MEDYLLGAEHYESRLMSKSVGYKPNLFEPKTFNEKIAFLKIHRLIPNASAYADKILVRDFIASKGLAHLLPTLFDNFVNAEDFDSRKLPEEFVIKANFGSGTNIIVTKNYQPSYSEIISKLKSFDSVLDDFYFTNELHYLEIEKAFLVEEFLKEPGKVSPTDYKFHCSYGEVFMIQVDLDRFAHHSRILFDAEWNLLPVGLYYPIAEKGFAIPENISELAHAAQEISENLPYCRVDLYNLANNRVVFGEMTLTPGGNCENFDPISFDKIMGEKIRFKVS